jgi:large subunit ribosomal protein L21
MATMLRSSAASGVRPFSSGAATVAPRRLARCQATAYHPSPLTQEVPSKYAIVEVAGSQMFVEEGKWYTVNRLKADVGARIKFGRVLATKEEGKLTVGMPYLDKANVEAEVIEELRGPKIIVYKMRPKKHYRRKQGHRCGDERAGGGWVSITGTCRMCGP